MKRSLCLSFLLAAALLLAACGTATPDPPAPAETSAAEPEHSLPDSAAWRPQNGYGVCFLETEQVKYVLENKKIYFSPQGTDSFYLLCSRPDCSHTDENCNAYGGAAIGWYDGRLYAATVGSGGPKLISMQPDGSGHRVVAELLSPLYLNGQSGGTYWFYFCGGYLYYMIWPPSEEYLPTMARTDLRTGATDQPWADTIDLGLLGGHVSQFADGKWYMAADLRSGEETRSCILEADPEAGILTPILDNPGGVRALWWRVEDGTILYFEPGRGLCRCDWKAGEDRCLLERPGSENAECTFGLDYIYYEDAGEGSSERTVTLYDRELHPVDSFQLPANWSYVTETADRIYYGTSNWGWHIRAYIDKSEIGTGKLSLHEVEYC